MRGLKSPSNRLLTNRIPTRLEVPVVLTLSISLFSTFCLFIVSSFSFSFLFLLLLTSSSSSSSHSHSSSFSFSIWGWLWPVILGLQFWWWFWADFSTTWMVILGLSIDCYYCYFFFFNTLFFYYCCIFFFFFCNLGLIYIYWGEGLMNLGSRLIYVWRIW